MLREWSENDDDGNDDRGMILSCSFYLPDEVVLNILSSFLSLILI